MSDKKKKEEECPCCCQIFDSSAEYARSVLQPCGHVLCHACSEAALDLKMCPFCGQKTRAVQNLNPGYDIVHLQHDIQEVDISKDELEKIEFGEKKSIKMNLNDNVLMTPTPKLKNGGDVILSSMKKTLQNNLSLLTEQIQHLEHLSFHDDDDNNDNDSSFFAESPIVSCRTTPRKKSSPRTTNNQNHHKMTKDEEIELKYMKTVHDLQVQHRAELEALRKEIRKSPSKLQVNMMLRKQNENLRQTIKSMEKRLIEKMVPEKQYKNAQSEIEKLKSQLNRQKKMRSEKTIKLNKKIRQLESDLIALRTCPSPKHTVQPSVPHSLRSSDTPMKRVSHHHPLIVKRGSFSQPKSISRKKSAVQPGGVRREGREWVAHYHTRNSEDHFIGRFETKHEALEAYRKRQEYYHQKRILRGEDKDDEDREPFSSSSSFSPPSRSNNNKRNIYSNNQKRQVLLPPPSSHSRLPKKVVANALRNIKRVVEKQSIGVNKDTRKNDYSYEYPKSSIQQVKLLDDDDENNDKDEDEPDQILERLLEEARTYSSSFLGGSSY
jgi:hypothetical protein